MEISLEKGEPADVMCDSGWGMRGRDYDLGQLPAAAWNQGTSSYQGAERRITRVWTFFFRGGREFVGDD